MVLKFIILVLILQVGVGQLTGQVSQETTIDTLRNETDKDLINQYIRQQRTLALQLKDTLTNIKTTDTANYDAGSKSKFVILCFNLSKSTEEEIASLNKIAKEYEKYVSSIVIKADDLNKYKELFNTKEYNSLQNFIGNKTDMQRRSTSFPVILVLHKNGQILNAWSGDKTEDGLKKEDYYAKIKAGLETMQRKN